MNRRDFLTLFLDESRIITPSRSTGGFGALSYDDYILFRWKYSTMGDLVDSL